MSSFRSSGRFDAALLAMREDLADPVADRVVEVLRMARATGGSDLGQVLRSFSDLLREEARLRAEIEARASWTVNAARVAVAAPWLVLGMLATSSGVLDAYDSPGGALLLSLGAAVCLFAYRLMLRLGRVPGEQRVMTS
jgi:tight adherence protein B